MTLLRKSLVPPKRKSSARVHNKQINFVLIYYAIQKQKDQIGLLLNLYAIETIYLTGYAIETINNKLTINLTSSIHRCYILPL